MQIPAGERTTLDVIPVDMVAAGMLAALAALLDRSAPPVMHLTSGDENPLPVRRVIELCGLYKRKHYQNKSRGNPFANLVISRIESISVSKEAFYRHGAPAIAKAASGLAGLLTRAAVGPAAALFKPAAKAARSYGELAKRNGEIWELYLPFIAETDCQFVAANMRALRARMPAADREKLGWEPETLEWRSYMHEVHIPGLERWVMPQIEAKVARPARPLRPHDSLLAMLDEVADRNDHATALARFETTGLARTTFRELATAADRAAAKLASAGARPGDRVLLSGKNDPTWAMAYFGILRAGAIAVPVDPAMEEAALANVLGASGAAFAIVDDARLSSAGAALSADGPGLAS